VPQEIAAARTAEHGRDHGQDHDDKHQALPFGAALSICMGEHHDTF
jgi:hypothetical protein